VVDCRPVSSYSMVLGLLRFSRARKLVVAAAALGVLLPGAVYAAGPVAPAAVTRVYAASDDVFANPGRGFFTYTETHLLADGSGYVPLDAGALAAARMQEGRSLVFRIFYLEKYQGADTITAADLKLIRADFAAARAAGVKMVVRFAYSAESDADAPVARVLKHISQLKPILTGEADLITAVQAGFVGRWGEWHYTRNFTRADWSDRRQVLAALLAATPASVPVQVRTPQYKRKLVPANSRVGIHNDCFLAGTDDYGTYTAADDRAWLAGQGASTLVGGETCDVSERSGWANAGAEMAAYHWSYLNPSFNRDVLESWGPDGLAEAERSLGYRIRLVRATLPSSAAKPGSKVSVSLTLVNEGYAAAVQNRPVRVILSDGKRVQSVAVSADVRAWVPGKEVTVGASFSAPVVMGDYALSLSLPDPGVRLAGVPAYAIRLANPGVWDESRGWNSLGGVLKVAR
jgi:hypothetical protein